MIRLLTFWVQKFRRQLVGFMFRMIHSQPIAEELAQEVFYGFTDRGSRTQQKPSSLRGCTASRRTWR